MVLKNDTLPSTLGDLHTCLTDGGEKLDHISLVNSHSSAVTVNLYYLASGDTAGTGTTPVDETMFVTKDLSLNPNVHYTVEKPVYLATGDKIRGYASVPSVIQYIIQGISFSIESVVS